MLRRVLAGMGNFEGSGGGLGGPEGFWGDFGEDFRGSWSALRGFGKGLGCEGGSRVDFGGV